jgi:ketosteroid isomerase-like protein
MSVLPTIRPPISPLHVVNSTLTRHARTSAVHAACRAMSVSAIHVRCMDKLTEDAVREIERIHSSWIEFEAAGEDERLLALCADDIELWPPDAQPVLGRASFSAQLAHRVTKIHSVQISDLRIRGSNQIAYLTASYKTTFSSGEDPTPRQALGSHLWILEKRAGKWGVVLVSWSLCLPAAISGARESPPLPGARSTS